MDFKTFLLGILTVALVGCGGSEKKAPTSNNGQSPNPPTHSKVTKTAVTQVTATASFQPSDFQAISADDQGGELTVSPYGEPAIEVLKTNGAQILDCPMDSSYLEFPMKWQVRERNLILDSPILKAELIRDTTAAELAPVLGNWVNSAGDGIQSTLEENQVSFYWDEYEQEYVFTWTKTCSRKYEISK